LWAGRIFVEFSSEMIFDPLFFPFFRKNWHLLFMGFFYNLAIWIDKFVFWLSPQATAVTGFLRVHTVYDSATFFAFLTIIPALAIFLLQVETGFYQQYRRYYLGIIDKASYRQVERMREDIAAALRESLGLLVRYQGIISFLFVIFAPQLIEMLGLPATITPVFRIAVLGALMHCLALIMVIIMLYFDFQKEVLAICSFFVLANGGWSLFTIKIGTAALGYGYFFAAFITAFLAFYVLDYKLRNLNFYTFAPQPLGVHREEGVG